MGRDAEADDVCKIRTSAGVPTRPAGSRESEAGKRTISGKVDEYFFSVNGCTSVPMSKDDNSSHMALVCYRSSCGIKLRKELWWWDATLCCTS